MVHHGNRFALTEALIYFFANAQTNEIACRFLTIFRSRPFFDVGFAIRLACLRIGRLSCYHRDVKHSFLVSSEVNIGPVLGPLSALKVVGGFPCLVWFRSTIASAASHSEVPLLRCGTMKSTSGSRALNPLESCETSSDSSPGESSSSIPGFRSSFRQR